MFAEEVLLLNDDACQSNGFELKPLLAVAVPVVGISAPAAVTVLLNAPVVDASPAVNAAVVPVNAPVRVPPVSCK